MIVAEGEVHHRTDHDLAVQRHGSLLNLVQSENTNLRGIQDRRAHERPEDAAVRDRKRPACEIFERQGSISRSGREVANRELDLRERHPVGVAQHGHDETALGTHRNSDVVVVLVDDFIALDFGVELRETCGVPRRPPLRRKT